MGVQGVPGHISTKNKLDLSQGGREAKLETGFLFGCVLYRMLPSVKFLPRWPMPGQQPANIKENTSVLYTK